MPKIIDGKKYYTLKESSEILDNNIEKSADLLIKELKNKRENRKLKNKNLMYV